MMSKIIDFYKKAQENEALKADLEAAGKTLAEKKETNEEVIIAEVIKIAAKHEISLEPADLKVKQGEVDEAELEAVAGGKSKWTGGCFMVGVSDYGVCVFGGFATKPDGDTADGGCIAVGVMK
jgi:hypothetical protein